ncbi:hypothetical protein ACSBR1_022342 [Camellia fascicularis]
MGVELPNMIRPDPFLFYFYIPVYVIQSHRSNPDFRDRQTEGGRERDRERETERPERLVKRTLSTANPSGTRRSNQNRDNFLSYQTVFLVLLRFSRLMI